MPINLKKKYSLRIYASTMTSWSKHRFVFLLFVFCLILVPADSYGQCAMCRAVLESEASGNAAEGVNNGIMYLMAIPYVLVAGIFYFIYRKMRS